MKQVKRLLSLVIALTMVFGVFALSAQAKSKAAPISLKVETSTAETGYTGVVAVTVTVKNTSGKDVKNIVITSCGSKGLCMYRPIDYNVVITNPGYSKPLTKKDAMTTCLKPGGTIKYVYCVLLGYQYCKRLVPEATRRVMLEQHKLLKTKNFRPLSIKANYLECCGAICFGDVKTSLDVKAYYNVGNSAYDKIADGASLTQNTAADAPAARTSAASASRSSSSNSTASGASASSASSASGASAAVVNAAKKVAAAVSTASSSASKTPDSDTVRTFVTNSQTKVYHTKNCGHWPTVNRENKESTVSKLESEGYTLCEFCAGTK